MAEHKRESLPGACYGGIPRQSKDLGTEFSFRHTKTGLQIIKRQMYQPYKNKSASTHHARGNSHGMVKYL
jgi:hypothetical protein